MILALVTIAVILIVYRAVSQPLASETEGRAR
jgi:hypothetical protein